MRSSPSVLTMLGISLAMCVTHVLGIDPQAQAPSAETRPRGDLEDTQALQEISRVREKLGGSVLQGSILDSSDGAGFDVELRNMLELPPKKSDTKPLREKLSDRQIVAMLRRNSSQLDGIANQLETLRQYNNADRLRDVADQLRLVARQMDPSGPPVIETMR